MGTSTCWNSRGGCGCVWEFVQRGEPATDKWTRRSMALKWVHLWSSHLLSIRLFAGGLALPWVAEILSAWESTTDLWDRRGLRLPCDCNYLLWERGNGSFLRSPDDSILSTGRPKMWETLLSYRRYSQSYPGFGSMPACAGNSTKSGQRQGAGHSEEKRGGSCLPLVMPAQGRLWLLTNLCPQPALFQTSSVLGRIMTNRSVIKS